MFNSTKQKLARKCMQQRIQFQKAKNPVLAVPKERKKQSQTVDSIKRNAGEVK
jgi:hypothetical protein